MKSGVLLAYNKPPDLVQHNKTPGDHCSQPTNETRRMSIINLIGAFIFIGLNFRIYRPFYSVSHIPTICCRDKLLEI